jgi:hypothetical protein
MVPLVPVLEAEPSAIPHWAFAEGMIHVQAQGKLCVCAGELVCQLRASFS